MGSADVYCSFGRSDGPHGGPIIRCRGAPFPPKSSLTPSTILTTSGRVKRMHTALRLQHKSHVMGMSHVISSLSHSFTSLRPPGAIFTRNICTPCYNHVRRGVFPRTPLRAHTAINGQYSGTVSRPRFDARAMSWIPKLRFASRQQDLFNGPMDNQEEAAKVAILEKTMKGRQPTDLMLRCAYFLPPVGLWSDRNYYVNRYSSR